MSDSEGDFSDELLELAGAGEKRRKKSSSKSSKRRKAEYVYHHCIRFGTLNEPCLRSVESESENEYESEEDDFNPYPLEGKFVDEADRQR